MVIPLNVLPVGTGRLMNEAGEIVNFADVLKSGGVVNLDLASQMINDGNFFTASKLFTTVADDAISYIRAKSGDKYCSFSFSVSVTGKAYIFTYSGTTYTVDGTATLLVNRNTTAGLAAPETVIYHTPTVNVLGTKRFEDLIPGGEHVQTRAGSVGGASIVTKLAPDQDLLIAVQNKSGAAIDASVVINFFETEE